MKIEPLTKVKHLDYALLTPGNKTLFVETKYGKSFFQGSRDV